MTLRFLCLNYALRRLSSFVSLEFTKNVRCAVLLIRYAVPAQPHKQHVKKSIQPVYRNSGSVRKCNCCRDWLITKVTISKMWNFSSCKVSKQLKFQVFNKDGLILTTQMVRYLFWTYHKRWVHLKYIRKGISRAGTPGRHPGPAHALNCQYLLVFVLQLKKSLHGPAQRVTLLCSNFHWNFGLTSESSTGIPGTVLHEHVGERLAKTASLA